MKELKTITNWFKSQCDGDWEHENGIKIFTCDNPGFGVCIDLIDTNLEGLIIHYEFEKSELNWMTIDSTGSQFKGYGGIDNLQDILAFFINECITKSRKDFSYNVYGKIVGYHLPIFRRYETQLIEDNIHKIIAIPDLDISELKFDNFDYVDKIDFSKISVNAEYNIGDYILCELKIFADSVGIEILSKKMYSL